MSRSAEPADSDEWVIDSLKSFFPCRLKFCAPDVISCRN